MTYEALIIGGGPAGATTALLLARAGWSVGLVEKAGFPRRKVCGEFLSATNLPLLNELGIAEFYRERAGPEVRRVGLFAADAQLAAAMPVPRSGAGKWGRALGREHLDHALLDLARRNGATIWQPWAARTLERSADGFTCTIARGRDVERLAARIVVMANGSWERALPARAAPAHKPSDLLAFKAHFRGAALPGDLMPLVVFPGGYGGLVRSDGERVTLSCCIRRDELARCRRRYGGPGGGDAVLRHLESSCAGVRQTLRNARREGAWLSAGPIRPGIRRGYADGMFFVGNAAGEAHPIVAEGISMAMQSAWLLCGHLVRGQDEPLSSGDAARIGRAYEAAWVRQFAGRIHAAAAFAHIAMRPPAVALLLPLIRRLPSLLTLGAQLSGKVDRVVPIG